MFDNHMCMNVFFLFAEKVMNGGGGGFLFVFFKESTYKRGFQKGILKYVFWI